MKTITTVLAAFIITALVIFGSQAIAGPLSEREEIMLGTYLTDESARLAIQMEYWQMIANQADDIKSELPHRVSEHVAVVNLEYDGKRTTTYTYYIDDPRIDLDFVKSQMVARICFDPQIALYLTTFEGEMHYTYFMYPNDRTIWGEFHINQKDCGSGI